jgi:hypothetical protein
MLRFLARFLAVVCALVFVIGTIPIVFFHAAGTRLIRPQIYKDALAKERIYDRLPALATDTTAQAIKYDSRVAGNRGGAGGESPISFANQLSVKDWETVFGAVLPPSYVHQQTERALDQFFGWLHSSTAVPVVNIELGEVKRRLTTPETEEAYIRLLQTKPPYTASQPQSAGELPVGFCPPPEEMPRVRQEFRTMMQEAASELPAKVDLFTMLNSDDETAEAARKWAEVRARVVQLEELAWWSPAVPAVLLLLIVVFAVRSFRGWMFWWGIPCLIVGTVSAVLAFSVVPAGRWMLAQLVVPYLPAEVSATTLEAMAGLVTAVLQPAMTAALHTASALAIGGLVAVILGAVCKSRPKSAVAPRP